MNNILKEIINILFWDLNLKIGFFVLFIITAGLFHHGEMGIGTVICVAVAFLNLGQFISSVSILWLETNENQREVNQHH